MRDILIEVKSVRIKTLFGLLVGLWLCSQISTYFLLESYTFENIPKHSIKHQKSCLSQFLDVFKSLKIPLILFDIEILPELFQARPKSWHNSKHECKTLCKFHPEDKSLISFAVEGNRFVDNEGKILASLKKKGFVVHVTTARDPRAYVKHAKVRFIPTYMWVAKQDHVIHVAILYERANSYVWVGPVTDKNWKHTVDVLAPELTDGWHSMEKIRTKFPVYEQAFEKSHKFLALPLDIDGHRVNVPYHMQGFLKEYRESHYIECNHAQARKYKRDFELDLPDHEEKYKARAKSTITRSKKVLDDVDIPFWLNGATLLGWFRQCDIIPHSQSVNFAIRASDYSEEIIKTFEQSEFLLIKKFGHPSDSLELSFLGKEGVYLDIFLLYEDEKSLWSGGTQAHDARRYKFVYPKTNLCWSELLEMKLRVPCLATQYVEAAFGLDWMIPKKDWIWNLHPPNVETNGKWHSSEWGSMIQHIDKTLEQEKQLESYEENRHAESEEELVRRYVKEKFELLKEEKRGLSKESKKRDADKSTEARDIE